MKEAAHAVSSCSSISPAGRAATPDEIGVLAQDFFCERPEQMNYKELAQRADYFKAEAGLKRSPDR